MITDRVALLPPPALSEVIVQAGMQLLTIGLWAADRAIEAIVVAYEKRDQRRLYQESLKRCQLMCVSILFEGSSPSCSFALRRGLLLSVCSVIVRSTSLIMFILNEAAC